MYIVLYMLCYKIVVVSVVCVKIEKQKQNIN